MYWNPDPDLFIIPFLNHPIKWYGFFFVSGFICGYFITLPRLKPYSADPQKLMDKLLWFVLGGTIIGARLGHILFYEPLSYLSHPLDILKIWEGGLASHGGAIGIILALFLFRYTIKKECPSLTVLKVLDIIVVPTALVGCFIRLGNFFNQEIIGTGTSLPWGIIFGHPFDGSPVIPRHPSQLYEALAYLLSFIALYILRDKVKGTGKITGLFFILIFTSRFLIEFTKEQQIAPIDQNFLQMGQWLSLPFILVGIYLWVRPSFKTSEATIK